MRAGSKKLEHGYHQKTVWFTLGSSSMLELAKCFLRNKTGNDGCFQLGGAPPNVNLNQKRIPREKVGGERENLHQSSLHVDFYFLLSLSGIKKGTWELGERESPSSLYYWARVALALTAPGESEWKWMCEKNLEKKSMSAEQKRGSIDPSKRFSKSSIVPCWTFPAFSHSGGRKGILRLAPAATKTGETLHTALNSPTLDDETLDFGGRDSISIFSIFLFLVHKPSFSSCRREMLRCFNLYWINKFPEKYKECVHRHCCKQKQEKGTAWDASHSPPL